MRCKAKSDSKAQRTRQYVSISNRFSTPQRAARGFSRPASRRGPVDDPHGAARSRDVAGSDAATCSQRNRQRQLPSTVPGEFIRAAESRPMRSCIGTIASTAFEAYAASIRKSGTAGAGGRSSDCATTARAGPSRLAYQPTVVSLSCVPV